MEPVTHVLTGACLARCGLNRRAAYTTLAMAIAAELPDIDTLWSLRGPVEGLQHHRGITHTFLGLPFEAAFVLALVYLLHRWRIARARKRGSARPANVHPADDHIPIDRPLTAAPVRWGLLYGFCILALLSHLLLDYTNNYGLRPFYPFNPHWYAASIVFIFDPLIFALLVLGLVAPLIFRLISAEVGARRRSFAARGWSAAALLLVVAVWGIRWIEHGRAMQLAMSQSLEAPAQPGSDASTQTSRESPQSPDEQPQTTAIPVYLSAQRALANPDIFSIFRWYTVTDFGPLYQLERADTGQQTIVATEGTFAKPDRSRATLAAEASPLGRVFLDWSPMPIITVDHSVGAVDQAVSGSDVPPPVGGAVVTLRDPRFMGVPLLRTEDHPSPLTGTVVLDRENHVILEALDGRIEPPR